MNRSWNNQQRNTSNMQQHTAVRAPIPYGFDAVEPSHAIHDAPAWRDGSSTEKRLSGELLITLEALSPLIVGNQQSKIDDQSNALVPQMLEDDRVILGGASLKGMLRSAIASLLHAPMERVQEHHYTYRPNLGFGPSKDPQREFRAAIVTGVDAHTGAVAVDLLPRNTSIVFVRSNVLSRLPAREAGAHIQCTVRNAQLSGTAPRQRLDVKDQRNEELNHHLYSYRGGIDGTGLLANAFSDDARTYRHVLVSAENRAKTQRLKIPDGVLKAYQETQKILANETIGHLQSAHPLAKKINTSQVRSDIDSNAKLEQHQLIYVEIENREMPNGNPGLAIRSMGHHFQYRWAYTSSVRHKNRLLDGQGQLRPELQNQPEEKVNPANGSPQQLTAARLFFGYALDKKNDTLGEDNFKRLAGRISFNHAVEVPDDKDKSKRFVNAGQPITLKVLGQPRPSAVEFYLKQGKLPGQLTTYGDLPADPGGDLAGRKHYRHQPDARQKISIYEAQKKTVQSNDRQGQKDPEVERGTTVRYLSQPGSTFKTTLRFDSLRPWELGALLLALQPELAQKLNPDIPKNEHGYAHKLGYGKPLGLGSVRLTVDGARWQQADSWQWQQCRATDGDYPILVKDCLAALKAKLQTTWGEEGMKTKLLAWLQPRQWKGKGYAAYPQLSVKEESTIFNFHTDLRKRHAKTRRGETEDFRDLQDLLNNKP